MPGAAVARVRMVDRDGGQKRIPVTAAAAIDPTDGDRFRSTLTRPLAPVLRLRFAVLAQAVHDVRRLPATNVLAHRARDWLESDATDWPLDFLRVCEALDLDPLAVRARALGTAPPTVRMWLHAIVR